MPDYGNRTDSDTQGAFGDQKKQVTEGQNETKYDEDSTLNLPGEKNTPQTAENQPSKNPVHRDEGH